MNQFKSAWKFAFANWKFFLMLALPIIAIESLTGYLVMPLNDLTQPEDFVYFFQANSLIIGMVGIVGLIVQISFIGGLWIGYMSIDTGKNISPIAALQVGFSKFLPLLGAYLIVTTVSALGFLMLILPGIYLTARFGLVAAQIMFEDNKVFESIGASWEKTDEYGSKLFMFTLVFVVLIFLTALLLSSIIPEGIVQIVVLALTEYIFMIPLGYIFFTLYKSIKVG